jgi:ketosteroid isomerase-like protein
MRTVLIGTLLMLAAVTPLRAQSAMADMAAVNKTLADLLSAYTKRDMNAVAAVMAPDVKAFGSSFSADGIDEFRRKGAPALSMVRGARPASKQDVAMSGNIAYVAFLVDTDRQSAANAPTTTTRMRWTIVFERRSSRWVVTHFHLSPEPAP